MVHAGVSGPLRGLRPHPLPHLSPHNTPQRNTMQHTLSPHKQTQAEGRRNKVPLEKGFSQVDWLRLAKSGKDAEGNDLRCERP